MSNYTEFGIFMTLLDGKSHTAAELASKFEISTKTVYRQTDKLVSAGYPITTVLGKNGGIMLANKYVCDTWFFSAEELSFIANLISSNKKINPQISNIILEKIKQHISNNNLYDATKKLDNLVIDNSLWFCCSKQNIEECSNLLDACENCQQIEIEYNGCSRTINPYCIVLKENCYYLYAYCTLKNDYRLFKISRISSFKILQDKFQKQNIDIQSKPWNNNNFEKIEIILVSKENLLSEFSSWSKATKLEDKKYKINATYNHGLINKLLEYGDKIKILSPQKIISDMVSTCHNITNLYV